VTGSRERVREEDDRVERVGWVMKSLSGIIRSSLEILDNSDASSMIFNFYFSPDYALLRHSFAAAMAVSAVRRFKSFNIAFLSKPASLLLICTCLQPHATFNMF